MSANGSGSMHSQGNRELHSMKVGEQEECCQINNRVLSTARKNPGKGSWLPGILIHSLQPQYE